MQKAQDVIGLPVLDTSSGKRIGNVKDIFFQADGEIMGLSVEAQGLFSKVLFLSFEHIGAIGHDAVTVGTDRFLSTLDLEAVYGLYTGKKSYKGLPIIATNGNELGHIEDVYFLEEMGKIIGYELSDGFFQDVTEGRKIIEHPPSLVIGEDAMIVPYDEIKEISPNV